MFQNGSLTNSNLCQEVMTKAEVFYVVFPVTQGKEIAYVTAKVKGTSAELSSIRSPVKDVVMNYLKKYRLKFYECPSMEDFDTKFALYRLTDDQDSFKESNEET